MKNMTGKMQAIDYAKAACDTMMRKFEGKKLPPQGHFHYHQGVFLSGVYQTYELCREEKYFAYMKEWVDSCVAADGTIHAYDSGQLDDIQPGILLFPLLDRTKSSHYQKALDELLDAIWHFPRNPIGGFFHKADLTNQMWLDGLYMAGPISAEYGYRNKRPEFIDCCVEQALLMRKMTEDKESGLWYHAWDYSKKAAWANPDTGLSPEFWGRSIGWVPVAVLNELDFIPVSHPKYQEMCSLVQDLLTAVYKYQSGEGRWYQVVNKGEQEGNWLENSCSCLFVAAMCKAVRKGLMDVSFLKAARKGYEAVINSLDWQENDIQIGNVCVGTGVGDYEHYCKRPVAVNDLHGVGAFLIMCVEAQKVLF